jgi:hypothetical protein
MICQIKQFPDELGLYQEYVATCSTYGEAVWLRKLITRLFDLELEVTYIFCDN